MTPLLSSEAVTGGYNGLPVVREVGLAIHPGEFVGLLGRNGVGKTTLLKLLTGHLVPLEGRVRWLGQDLGGQPLHRIARLGIVYVPEEGGVFRTVSVADNLRLHLGPPADAEWVLDLFPPLRPRLRVRAGLLSGGEQRMLALARALLSRPRLLVVDELSIGLQPSVIDRLMTALRGLREEAGLTMICVEQRIALALQMVERVLVMDKGRIQLDRPADALRQDLSPLARYFSI